MAARAFVSRFSPNRTDPKVLEAIFVQRHKLAEVWLERLRDSVLTEVKHHLLAVGPRGCGKSHLVALLVSRLRKDPVVDKRVRIAWLPEDETTPSFWKFLLRILRALQSGYPTEFPAPSRDELVHATDDRRATVLTNYLLEKLDGRTLLVVVENLDDVMRGLKTEGQKRWRAFLQEHRIAATLATSQQLTEDLSDRDQPFFNFFQIERLQPLTADEALSLLQKIASHNENTDLAAFLQTSTGRARVRAIRHLTGGSHRVFIILSEFATRENLDDLVTAFEELLDELTPYYQERLRWLPDQQREIVEFLCRQARTVAVKEIAGELFLTEQTAAAQLKGLKEKGYVMSANIGRESRYELAEPLMRLCVEVKDPKREPIRLIVEFLRIWYDRSKLECLCEQWHQNPNIGLCINAALQAPDSEADVLQFALDHDFNEACFDRDRGQQIAVAKDILATSNDPIRCLVLGVQLHTSDCIEESKIAFDQATDINPKDFGIWLAKGVFLSVLNRTTEALVAFDHSIKLKPNIAIVWVGKGKVLVTLARRAEALHVFNQAVERFPNSKDAWMERGLCRIEMGDTGGLSDLKHALKIDPTYFPAAEALAWVLSLRGKWNEVWNVLAAPFRNRAKDLPLLQQSHLPRFIAAMFKSTTDHRLWAEWVAQLVVVYPTKEALTYLGNALIRSLQEKVHTELSPDSLTAWAEAWQKVAERHPDLSLSVRLFSVGVRYLQTKDERVLLDLLQEERMILRELFGLDEVDTPKLSACNLVRGVVG